MKGMLRIGLIASPLDKHRKQICNRNGETARRYGEEFKRQAMELMIYSGKTQRQVARELDVSQYSFESVEKAYLSHPALE